MATGPFLVASRSQPGNHRLVQKTSDGWTCTCPGFAARKRCWHVDQAAPQAHDPKQKATGPVTPKSIWTGSYLHKSKDLPEMVAVLRSCLQARAFS